MPIRNHTGIIPYRLNGEGGGQTQQFQAGASASWLMRSIPKLTQGKLCNYLLGFCVTISGSVVVGAGGTSEGPGAPGSVLQRTKILSMWDIIRMVIASVEVQSAWHGTALSSQHVKGSFLELLEFVGNGMEKAYRMRPPMYYDAQTPERRRYFRASFFLPLCLLAGVKGHHTALPAAMYENAQLLVNFGSGDMVSQGHALYGLTATPDCRVDVSALLLPQDEVWVGPPVQWIDYQQRVSDSAIDINGLGTVSTMDRTEKGAGIAGLFWLSNRFGLPGPGLVRDITDIAFPFRDVIHTRHLDPLIRQFENIAAGGPANVAGPHIGPSGDGADTGSGDVGGFPYDIYDYGVTENGDGDPLASTTPPNPGVLALICPTRDLEVTKVQQSEGTQQLQLQFRDGALGSGGTCGTTHHILACQLHSWTPEAWASAKQLLIEKGIVRSVVGTDDTDWSLKVLNKQNPLGIMDRKRRFMAMKLVPMVNAAPKVS